ncbi:TPA: NAD(P)H-dependent oxidoreductase [Candidatus Woesearchaeota archaeon]|nr:NADPH-dependent oxidoreductase [archaeon]HIJ11448.1 NAD(P)H-dependent oxidoreductase [Candidatus Woesearchaeota archaeon]
MNYTIVIGSHRAESQSTKVGSYIANQLKSTKSNNVTLLDLRQNPLPLWDESAWQRGSKLQKVWKPYATKLSSCQALIVISPEWGGMVPAGLKNFFLYCGKTVAHKPALIVAISASRGGAYPIAELRMSSYKNIYLNYIPEHIIIRNVENVLNDTSLHEDKSDLYIKNRIIHALGLLEGYGKALQGIAALHDFEKYPYGM